METLALVIAISVLTLVMYKMKRGERGEQGIQGEKGEMGMRGYSPYEIVRDQWQSDHPEYRFPLDQAGFNEMLTKIIDDRLDEHTKYIEKTWGGGDE